MKKLIFFVTLITAAGLGSATAREDRQSDRNYHQGQDYNLGQLTISFNRGPASYHIRHLNQMRAQVRAQLQAYRSGRRLRARFQQVSFRIDQVNIRFRTGRYHPQRLRAEIQQLHAELHQIEQALRLPRGRFYNWR